MKNQSKEGRNPSASPLEKYFQHYNEKNLLPLHMPGHQRKVEMGTALPYAYDYTEVEELDNLHAPEGILQEAMNRTAAYYGCSDCFYLVNGSSSGLQAGIFTLLGEGDEGGGGGGKNFPPLCFLCLISPKGKDSFSATGVLGGFFLLRLGFSEGSGKIASGVSKEQGFDFYQPKL